MRTGSGNQFNKKNIEFNPDVGSSLLEYASTLDAVKLPDDQTTKSIVHLQNLAYQQAPNLPSGPEAAKEIKAAVARGGVLLVKAILEHVHVDARDKKGRTALSHAAERGQLEMAQFLLDNGASVSARQWSVSGWAEGRSPYRNSGATPLWHATASGHLKMVKLLLAHGANPQARTTAGGTPLAMACQNGCTEIVKVLLSKGVDVNARNYKDVSLYH